MNTGDWVGAVLVFTIVFLIFISAAFKRYLKHKENLSEKQPQIDAEEFELRSRNQERIIQSLRERIEALESIVVRDEYELNRKFKEL